MDAARQRRVRETARWLSVRAQVIRLLKASCEDLPDEADDKPAHNKNASPTHALDERR
jgi:hypothetical protein